jgi:macrodomain Ter protein organizer (MatP/YcbG family)
MSHAEKASQIGHNSKEVDRTKDENTKKTVQEVAIRTAKIKALNEEIKDILNDAKKNNGDLKTSIRASVKNLFMTSDQRQAKKEIDLETDRVTKLCKDLPLFKSAA